MDHFRAPRRGGERLPGQLRWGWRGRAGAGQGTRGHRGDGRGGAAALPPGDPQPHPGRPAHHLRRAGYTASGHTPSTPAATDKSPQDTPDSPTARTDAPTHFQSPAFARTCCLAMRFLTVDTYG